MLNDLVARAFAAAGVPVAKEPVGLVRQDGKRPDGLTLIPFEGGWSLTWDVTVYTTADFYIDLGVHGPGCVAEMAASRKEAKYATLRTHYDFQTIAVETLGLINEISTSFLHDLGRRISLVSGEDREPQFLFQRVSVAIQRSKRCFCTTDFCLPTTRISDAPVFNFHHYFFLPREYTYRGKDNNHHHHHKSLLT